MTLEVPHSARRGSGVPAVIVSEDSVKASHFPWQPNNTTRLMVSHLNDTGRVLGSSYHVTCLQPHAFQWFKKADEYERDKTLAALQVCTLMRYCKQPERTESAKNETRAPHLTHISEQIPSPPKSRLLKSPRLPNPGSSNPLASQIPAPQIPSPPKSRLLKSPRLPNPGSSDPLASQIPAPQIPSPPKSPCLPNPGSSNPLASQIPAPQIPLPRSLLKSPRLPNPGSSDPLASQIPAPQIPSPPVRLYKSRLLKSPRLPNPLASQIPAPQIPSPPKSRLLKSPRLPNPGSSK
ncbi:vegetative cell wall protein gp1-like [Penaeus japonicus]|uniref:vegetative cell wall protein gp1-like n=1 Tax=Penaeus japonicus TaxID=27405 RepID=UPI001C70BC59|nr:vegetative cell wall protein gp1-like [Penaeus japonicus]